MSFLNAKRFTFSLFKKYSNNLEYKRYFKNILLHNGMRLAFQFKTKIDWNCKRHELRDFAIGKEI